MTCTHCSEPCTAPEVGFLCRRCRAPLATCVRCMARLVARLRQLLGPEKARRAITQQTTTAAAVIELETGHRC